MVSSASSLSPNLKPKNIHQTPGHGDVPRTTSTILLRKAGRQCQEDKPIRFDGRNAIEVHIRAAFEGFGLQMKQHPLL